jgi:glycosyltransferase involved in cell wall biosynthesis
MPHTAPLLSIALVTETWPPEVNGVAMTIARVAEGLARRGHEIRLVRPRQAGEQANPARQAWLADELTVPSLPLPRYSQVRVALPSTGALMERWRERRPDVVHIATEGPLGWGALRAAEQLGLPVTSDYRTRFDAYGSHYRVGWLRRGVEGWLRRFHQRTGCTMVPTRALAQALAASGHERLTVVSRGVDAQRHHPRHRSAALRAAWGAGDDAPVLLYVGRLAPEKNLAVLARAWDAVRRAQPAAKLVLVGDGPYEAALRRLCPEAIHAGVQRGEALSAHYASADIFVFPSVTETWGNVVPEAMASSLAVLAFDDAAAAELINDGRNGHTVLPGDADAFVRRAAWLVQHLEHARACGAQARNTALALDWDCIVHAFESVLRAEIGRRLPATAAWPGSGAWAEGAR